jgi:hypothetical protein
VVAAEALTAPGSAVITSDPDDLTALLAGYDVDVLRA